MKELNKDFKARDAIIFDETPDWGEACGGVIRFTDLTLEQLKRLIEGHFIWLNETQNDSPSTMEFLEFMERYPMVTCHGYAVSPDRDDYRVTIEGLSYKGLVNRELSDAFLGLCKHADNLSTLQTDLYSWWD